MKTVEPPEIEKTCQEKHETYRNTSRKPKYTYSQQWHGEHTVAQREEPPFDFTDFKDYSIRQRRTYKPHTTSQETNLFLKIHEGESFNILGTFRKAHEHCYCCREICSGIDTAALSCSHTQGLSYIKTETRLLFAMLITSISFLNLDR